MDDLTTPDSAGQTSAADQQSTTANADPATADAAPGDSKPPTADQVKVALRKVKDPELNLNIIDLGLVYAISVGEGDVNIDMTLTSPNCPSAAELPGQVRKAVAGVSGVREAKVTIIWDPPWDPSRMSDEARTELNMW